MSSKSNPVFGLYPFIWVLFIYTESGTNDIWESSISSKNTCCAEVFPSFFIVIVKFNVSPILANVLSTDLLADTIVS